MNNKLLHAVVIERGALRILRVPIAKENQKFYITTAPYPMPDGTGKRIFHKADAIIPDTPVKAVRFYLAHLEAQKIEFNLILQSLQQRINNANDLLEQINQDETLPVTEFSPTETSNTPNLS
jgi:hypothetical protein